MAPVNLLQAAVRADSPMSLIPSSWDSEVRELRMSDRREAGLALAQSFATDPLTLYFMGMDDATCLSSDKTWKLYHQLMTYTYASYKFRGIATSIGQDFDSVALWMPPGTTNDDWLATLWSGTWRLWYQLPRECRIRFFDEVSPALHDTRAEVMGHRNDDCYYLGYIGTKASARHRGHASKLLEHMMNRADQENRPMYLESSHVRNNAFYAKFGFVFKKEIVFARGPVPVTLYCMVREPQSDKASSRVGTYNEKE